MHDGPDGIFPDLHELIPIAREEHHAFLEGEGAALAVVVGKRLYVVDGILVDEILPFRLLENQTECVPDMVDGLSGELQLEEPVLDFVHPDIVNVPIAEFREDVVRQVSAAHPRHGRGERPPAPVLAADPFACWVEETGSEMFEPDPAVGSFFLPGELLLDELKDLVFELRAGRLVFRPSFELVEEISGVFASEVGVWKLVAWHFEKITLQYYYIPVKKKAPEIGKLHNSLSYFKLSLGGTGLEPVTPSVSSSPSLYYTVGRRCILSYIIFSYKQIPELRLSNLQSLQKYFHNNTT